ncbi:MAG: hypothetical protein JNM52_11420 [Betaproteobacteria bacterium]|nr:hypothetical protein [Betaproteobacteria bacterium]
MNTQINVIAITITNTAPAITLLNEAQSALVGGGKSVPDFLVGQGSNGG